MHSLKVNLILITLTIFHPSTNPIINHLNGGFVSLYSCLGDGTGHRTATMVAPLLVTIGLARYEVALQVFLFGVFLYVWGGIACRDELG